MVAQRAKFSLAAEKAVEDFISDNADHEIFSGCVSVQQKRNRLCSLGSSAFATFFNKNNNDKFLQYVNFPDDAAKQKNERRNCTKQLQRLVKKNDDDANVADVVNNNNNFTNLSNVNVDLTHDLSAAQSSNPNVAAAVAAAAPSADVLGVNNTDTDYDATSLLRTPLRPTTTESSNAVVGTLTKVVTKFKGLWGVNNTDTDYDATSLLRTPLRPTTTESSNAVVDKLTGLATQLTERSLAHDRDADCFRKTLLAHERDFDGIRNTLTGFAYVSNKHESDIQLVKSDVKTVKSDMKKLEDKTEEDKMERMEMKDEMNHIREVQRELFDLFNTPAKPAASKRISFAPMTPTSISKKKQPAATDDVTSVAVEEQIQSIHI